MKSTKPIYIILLGALVTAVGSVLFFILFLPLHLNWFIESLLLLFSISVFSFFIYFLLLKKYITDRLSILYRSIRKGKFNGIEPEPLKLTEDIIEKVERETRKWSLDQSEEISKLKEQEEFRREFIGNLAHELKTPVFSIQGYILTLLEGGLEDDTVNRSFLERASKATERMTAILEDLDQLTRMEVNDIRLDFETFDIVELVKDIFEELEMKAKKKKIKLKFAKDYDVIKVRADRAKIAQVLTNIIGNSIYYGNDKGETVVRFYNMDDIITVEVSDNGPGIEEQHLSRLFERFYRVEKSRNRNEGGSGLGLAIAKKIIEAHGQTINVRSTVGVGSTFTFSLDKAKSVKR